MYIRTKEIRSKKILNDKAKNKQQDVIAEKISFPIA